MTSYELSTVRMEMKATSKVGRYYFSAVVPQNTPQWNLYYSLLERARKQGLGALWEGREGLADKVDKNLCNFV